jgi:peptidoglycan/xylan/chitin deacetylase (PgdA/CDA1 family)
MSLVTLTFDNGPSVDTTPFVLEQLKARGLTAYFCLVGAQLVKGAEQVDIAKETLTQGHNLVNHSLTHSVALGDDPSIGHATREIAKTHSLLCDRLGEWGEHWFRPFGRGGEMGRHLLSTAALQELEALDYSLLLWNSVPRDWEDTKGWVDTALKEIDERQHTVVVLHDLNTGAMDHLGQFLDTLLERGDVVTMDLPGDCVPMRNGKRVWKESEFDGLVAVQSD